MSRTRMPEAFGVRFVCAIVASSAADANELVARLRQLSIGMGFDPGPGQVKVLDPGELAKMPNLSGQLEDARVRARLGSGPAASEVERAAARRAIARFCGGDEPAAEVLAALERAHGGYLPRGVARELVADVPQGAAA